MQPERRLNTKATRRYAVIISFALILWLFILVAPAQGNETAVVGHQRLAQSVCEACVPVNRGQKLIPERKSPRGCGGFGAEIAR